MSAPGPKFEGGNIDLIHLAPYILHLEELGADLEGQRLSFRGLVGDVLVTRELLERVHAGDTCPEIMQIDEEPYQPDNLHSVALSDDGKLATAKSDFPMTQWSPDFVHGADSLLVVNSLVQNMLQDGEQIATYPKITWKKPMASNADIEVATEPFTKSEQAPAVIGELTTTHGRTLYVRVTPNGAPLTKNKTSCNLLPIAMVQLNNQYHKRNGGLHEFELGPINGRSALEEVPEQWPSMIFDLINVAAIRGVREQREVYSSDTPDFETSFVGGYRDFTVPPPAYFLNEQAPPITMSITFPPTERVSPPPGAEFQSIIIDVVFTCEGISIGGGTCFLSTTRDEKVSKKHLKSVQKSPGKKLMDWLRSFRKGNP